MSLPALAIRLATVFALRGQTWAGASVLDQPVNPIEGLTKTAVPVIAVYSGDEVTKADSRDWLAGDRTLSLVVQIYLPPDLAVPNGPRIDALRDGGELALNLIWRQVESTLLRSGSPWAALWRNLVFMVHDVSSRPYLIEIDKGPRLVARETIFSLDTIAAPGFSAPADVWADLLTLMQSTSELQPLATLVDAAIRGGAELPTWSATVAQLGLRDGGARGIGLAPVDTTETGEAEVLGQITISELMQTPVVIDEP
jgi:hypothetical protein